MAGKTKKKNTAVYPHAVIEKAADNVPASVQAFVMRHKAELGMPERFLDYAECAFHDCMKGEVEQSAVRYVVKEYRSECRKTRKRWADSYHENVKGPETSRAFPFQELRDKRRVLSDDEWDRMFGGVTYEWALKEAKDKVEEWISDPDAPFTAYPARLTKQRIAKAAEMDTFLAMAERIEDEYDCDIENTLSAYIDEMTQVPTFAKRRKSIENSGNPVGRIDMSEDGSDFLAISVKDDVSVGDVVKTLDQKDQSIILYAITRAANESLGSQGINVGIRDPTCRVTGNNNPSAPQIRDIEQRCYGIAQQTYSWIRDGRQIGAVNYFSSAVYNPENKMMRIVLGDVIQEALLENRLRRIPNADMDRLGSKEAHIMALPIQKMWIRTYCLWKKKKIPECSMVISYDTLLTMLSFPTKNKRKNLNIAKEIFAEFRDCGLYVESFKPDNIACSIRVNFIPLTESEVRDLSVWGYGENGEVAIEGDIAGEGFGELADSRNIIDAQFVEG